MALTLETEQKLKDGKLIDFFSEDEERWTLLARSCYKLVDDLFPSDTKIRPDDVVKVLEPFIRVDDAFNDHLASNKLKEKYWSRHFCDLILDRTWVTVNTR
jgi:hypothetical protein